MRVATIPPSENLPALPQRLDALVLKDSRASYVIEGKNPPQDRIQLWGRAIGEAGRQPLDSDELLRLQRIVIGDNRFVTLGFRTESGFVGEYDRYTRMPLRTISAHGPKTSETSLRA